MFNAICNSWQEWNCYLWCIITIYLINDIFNAVNALLQSSYNKIKLFLQYIVDCLTQFIIQVIIIIVSVFDMIRHYIGLLVYQFIIVNEHFRVLHYKRQISYQCSTFEVFVNDLHFIPEQCVYMFVIKPVHLKPTLIKRVLAYVHLMY